MQKLCSTADVVEAYLLRSYLSSEGIATVIQGEHVAGLQGVVPFSPETSPQLWVVEEKDLERATELLSEYRAKDLPEETSSVVCKECGEAVEAQFTDCWNCGSALPDVEEKLHSVEPHKEEPGERESPGDHSSDNFQPNLTKEDEDSVSRIRSPLSFGVSRSDRELWIETLVVLGIAVIPDLYSCIYTWVWPESDVPYIFAADYLGLSVRGLSISGVILFLIYRSGDRWHEFGIVRPWWVLDPLIAILIWFSFIFVSYVWQELPFVEQIEKSFFEHGPLGHGEILLLVIASAINGFAEELAMRCYLIPRFERLFCSTWISVVLSSYLFASYHLYQGLWNASNIFWIGIVLGIAFCLLRRIWPIAIAHAVQDIIAELLSSGT